MTDDTGYIPPGNTYAGHGHFDSPGLHDRPKPKDWDVFITYYRQMLEWQDEAKALERTARIHGLSVIVTRETIQRERDRVVHT